MRASRLAVVVGGTAAIVLIGVANAPKHLGGNGTGTDPGTGTGTGNGQGAAAGGAFTGPVVRNLLGNFQAQIVVKDGKVVDVTFPVAGTSAGESRYINSIALPELRQEVLTAQKWQVSYVSGASYTSRGITESLQGAFRDAGLA